MDKLRKESRFCARLAAALDEIRAISLPRRAVCGQAQIADGFLAAQLPVNHSSEIGPLASLVDHVVRPAFKMRDAGSTHFC